MERSVQLSVLLPARNAGATIDAAMSSIRRQTFGDFELLALDDGSTDDTRARLETHARDDERVRVVSTGGLGLVGALNLGLSLARAPLLARMDADDESLPTRFEKSLAGLTASPDLAGVGTGVEIFRDDRPVSPNLQAYGRWLSSLNDPDLLFRERFIESPLCHPSTLLKTGVLRAAGGWRDGDFPEDWELWLRLLGTGHRLSCVPEVLHRWRDHDRRLTREDARYGLERHLDLKAAWLVKALPERRLVLWGATDTGRGLSKRLTRLGATVAGFVELNPRKIGQQIHGVPVVTPEQLSTLGAQLHVISCVAAKGARADIRGWMASHGLTELVDFTVAA